MISPSNTTADAQKPPASPSGEPQQERAAPVARGAPIALAAIAGYALATGLEFVGKGAAAFGVFLYVIGAFAYSGLLVVQPNEAKVLILFGRYIGTVSEPGFWCRNPFAKPRTVSLRVRNFQSERLKVNDAAGSPIEIAAVVVWCVADTAKAIFDVDDYEQFVTVQSETALRELAGRYSYDDSGLPAEESLSFRGNPDEVNGSLKVELQSRLGIAGIEVVDAGLTHLAYAPEIAALMLRRQAAEAVIAARRTLVRGVAGLVQTAVGELAESDLIELDAERKAAMMSSLMVVLSGDRTPTAVINTGSLYT
jgi:regulator of protease activity HflC (stomatin/prohibitin superfamily)